MLAHFWLVFVSGKNQSEYEFDQMLKHDVSIQKLKHFILV